MKWMTRVSSDMAVPPDIDLSVLAVFDAIHRDRSVTAAARRVGLSQPATSAALARLRRRFDDPLFVRTTAGMAPTPLADELAPAVRDVLDTVRRRILERPASDPADAIRTLRLAVSDASALLFLPRIVAHLQRVAPGWRLETAPLHLAGLPAALESGELELAIGNLAPLAAPGFYRQRLASTRYVVIRRRDHPVLRGAPTLRQYLEARHAVAHSPGAPPSVLEQFLAARGHVRDIAVRLPQFLLLPAVVAESDLIATLPAHVADAFALRERLVASPLPVKAPELVLHQCWHARTHRDPAGRWIRAMVLEALRAA
jgi:DNA-binding transcriptional LysR family regulator